MTWLLLALGALAFLTALNALWPLERLGRLLLAPSYLLQLFASETVPLHLLLNPLLVALLVWLGALSRWPGQLGLLLDAGALFTFVLVARRAHQSTVPALQAAFGPELGAGLEPPPVLARLQPLALVSGPWERVGNLSYGPTRRNLLDVYRPRALDGPAPVLLYVHGGGWVMGSKRQQGRVMLEHFLRHGWMCVSINYRLSPRAKWPDHLVDCKRALAWVHEHIQEYGGDPERVVVAGGSAGAQLAAMLALTQGRPELQPGFEQADTRVRACLAFYGPFDMGALFTSHKARLVVDRLSRGVFGTVPWESSAPFDGASPLKQVHAGAPPFLVVHGTHDLLVPPEQARRFAEALRQTSTAQVVHVELPGGIHAFDLFRSFRTALVVQAAFDFAQRALSLPTQVVLRSWPVGSPSKETSYSASGSSAARSR